MAVPGGGRRRRGGEGGRGRRRARKGVGWVSRCGGGCVKGQGGWQRASCGGGCVEGEGGWRQAAFGAAWTRGLMPDPTHCGGQRARRDARCRDARCRDARCRDGKKHPASPALGDRRRRADQRPRSRCGQTGRRPRDHCSQTGRRPRGRCSRTGQRPMRRTDTDSNPRRETPVGTRRRKPPDPTPQPAAFGIPGRGGRGTDSRPGGNCRRSNAARRAPGRTGRRCVPGGRYAARRGGISRDQAHGWRVPPSRAKTSGLTPARTRPASSGDVRPNAAYTARTRYCAARGERLVRNEISSRSASRSHVRPRVRRRRPSRVCSASGRQRSRLSTTLCTVWRR